jgi:hypothetical protein
LTLFVPVDLGADLLDTGAARVIDEAEIGSDIGTAATVQPLSGGRFRIWDRAPDDVIGLSRSAVVYVYSADGEGFQFPDGLEVLPNPNGYPCALVPPTFWELDDALTFYKSALARQCTCKILAEILGRFATSVIEESTGGEDARITGATSEVVA